MKLELFINFDGDCREALDFYAKVFRAEVQDLMTYSEAPPDPDYPLAEADKDRVMYAGIPVGGMVLMFSDAPAGTPFVKGNNLCPTLSMEDKDEVARLFNELKEGGQVYMELQQTFFCELYSMVEDKYGVIWQVMYYA